MAAPNSFFDVSADVGSEEEDEDYDEETGEPTKKPRRPKAALDDSSEEDEEDEDEEAAREVRFWSRKRLLRRTKCFLIDRLHEGSLRTRKMRTKRHAKHTRSGEGSGGKDDARSASKRTKFWTKRIWTLSEFVKMTDQTNRSVHTTYV